MLGEIAFFDKLFRPEIFQQLVLCNQPIPVIDEIQEQVESLPAQSDRLLAPLNCTAKTIH